MTPRLAYIILFTAISAFCQAQTSPLYSIDQMDKALIKKARIVVRKDDTRVTLKSKNSQITRHNKALTIRNKKGLETGQFRVFYKEGTEKVKDIKISVYDKNGKILKKVKDKEIEDYVAYDGMSLISDGRLKYFHYEPSEYPITIESSWTIESNNTLSLPLWAPISGNYMAVESSSYQIENNSNIPIRVSARNIENYNIQKINDLYYTLNDQEILGYERYRPSIYKYTPYVLAAPEVFTYEGYDGSYDNWKGFGSWINDELLSDKADLNIVSARRVIDNIITDKSNKRQIIQEIYDYVQENTRYILIGLDEGGLVPLSAQKVHEVKYGDCKALSFYMKSLLEAYDIKANYVIVRADSDIPVDIFEDFAHVAPANHIILNVPMKEDTIWLDCTSHTNPFNFLGSFTDDRLVLQVNEDGGQLVRTPSYGKDQNKTVRTGKVLLSSSGDIDADISIEKYGIKIDIGTYLKTLNQKDLDEYLTKNLFKKLDQLVIKNHDIQVIEDSIKTTETYQLSSNKYGEVAGNYMLLKCGFLPLKIPRLKKDNKRDHDIFFPRSEIQLSEIIYEIPSGYRWTIPTPISMESKYGSYSQTVSKVDNWAYKVVRKYEINKGTYTPEEYPAIKAFFDKIIKLESTKYSLSNKS